MRKMFLELFSFLLLFLVMWLCISLIPWTDIFKPKDKFAALEEKLGNFYIETLTYSNNQIEGETEKKFVNSIKDHICHNNDIDPQKIKVYLLNSNEVNAYALPGKNLVILSGLITYCQSADELAGVMAHEIAHIEKGHIMKKLSREIGFAALTSMITSGTGGVEALKLVASTAYDRKMETEADDTAIEYLLKSKINPAGMADLMYRLSGEESETFKSLSFLSTHPNSDERAERILELSGKRKESFKEIVSSEEWEDFQELF